MAFGKYSRVDGRRSASSYCSTVTIVVFVSLCLVGVWMMTSSSVAPVQNVEISSTETNSEKKQEVVENDSRQFEDSSGDVPDGAKEDTGTSTNFPQDENMPEDRRVQNPSEKVETRIEENTEEKPTPEIPVKESEEIKNVAEETSKNEEQSDGEGKNNSEGGEEDKPELGDTNAEPVETNENGQTEVQEKESEGEKKSESEESSTETAHDENNIKEKVDENQGSELEKGSGENKPEEQPNDGGSNEVFPSGAQSEILNETTTENGAFSTQAVESKNEKESLEASKSKGDQSPASDEYTWKLCNANSGADYIPCLDNEAAIKQLRSTKHYEHRERHCPAEGPTCLVPLPEGYKRPIQWPNSRDKIWYYNVPHTKLAEVKGHQNWVKVTGEYLTFPGGGTQFKHGALHYIDFIQESVPDIAWGKRSRVVLDVGCGVASLGGYLFDRGVITMSFAPKDEHEAQVQFALERGIPAISAVMGTKRLPYPGKVFDIVHCARCRVPWHIEGGKLLLELNRVLRPGGYFVWSATPVYQKLVDDIEIWNAMSALTKSMCWELVTVKRDKLNKVGAAIYKKPSDNSCYEGRSENSPPLCAVTDDPNAAWNVSLQDCMHRVPESESERGYEWPELWPLRLEKAPYWLNESQVGVYGKSAPEDFMSDYEHWKHVVSKSYLNGMGISWSNVRNVMDMRSIYGGFAAALKDMNVWVMNVVSIDAPDTLPIIYERGLFGMYHDWCESFSTYPRTYDLLHADHLFSKLTKRCKLTAVIAEVDRILRPEGKLIVRDEVETVNEIVNMAKSLQWEIRMTFSKDKEGLLCVQKKFWRPEQIEAAPAS